LAIAPLAGGALPCNSERVTAYTVLRLVHNWWRWPVLAAWLVLLVRILAARGGRREWSRGDERAAIAFVAAVDTQLLLGLVLYFGFSPYWSALHTAAAAALHDRPTRFFAVEHQAAMLLATIAAHVGRAVGKRKKASAARQRVWLAALIVFIVLVLWAIPWPWRDIGRPLLRLTF
jgi:hypothetical protein